MTVLVSVVRRSLWLILFAAGTGALAAWWRDRTDRDLAPAEWPPLEPAAHPPVASTDAPVPSESPEPDPPIDDNQVELVASIVPAEAAPSDTEADAVVSATSLVNALVDAPEARSVDGVVGGWVTPDDDGSCPISHPVKANDNSGIFHVQGGRFYDRTKAERCYSTTDAAITDGYRRAKH